MEQLRFTAVHEDGQHLVLSTTDGTELLLPVDARLRAALRTRSAPADVPATPLSPRDVQAMIRAGQSPEEVAEITGWPAERVERFEAPILAEREHVSSMAQTAHVRGRGRDGGVPTLGSRVLERLDERGVDTDNVGWDATRPEGGSWTVVVSFVAGQRQRAAAWQFDPLDRTVEALDDEARWLSEDEQALPGSATGGPASSRTGGQAPGKPLLTGRSSAGEVELMTSMRERSRTRGRRKKASTSRSDPAGLPQLEHAPEDVLPLEDLAYDPDTMGPPPAAHGEPPAPEAATDPSATGPSPAEGPDAEPQGAARQETDARERPGYDVPLEFDDDQEDLDQEDVDEELQGTERAPQDATLDDFFGPEADGGPDDDHADEDDPDDGWDQDDQDDDVTGAASEEDVRIELGDEALEEDAVELGGDLEDAAGASADEPAEDEGSTTDQSASTAGAGKDDVSSDAPEEATEDEPARPAAKAPRRKDGRPGVPSWDDIMFGAKGRRG